jgi:hypothetical protein
VPRPSSSVSTVSELGSDEQEATGQLYLWAHKGVEEKENLVAKQLAYLASDSPHSCLLQKPALYRSMLEKKLCQAGHEYLR